MRAGDGDDQNKHFGSGLSSRCLRALFFAGILWVSITLAAMMYVSGASKARKRRSPSSKISSREGEKYSLVTSGSRQNPFALGPINVKKVYVMNKHEKSLLSGVINAQTAKVSRKRHPKKNILIISLIAKINCGVETGLSRRRFDQRLILVPDCRAVHVELQVDECRFARDNQPLPNARSHDDEYNERSREMNVTVLRRESTRIGVAGDYERWPDPLSRRVSCKFQEDFRERIFRAMAPPRENPAVAAGIIR